MSNGNNASFLKNPVRFAERHMLNISHGLRSVTQSNAALSNSIRRKENYFSVGKEIRVVSCNLRPSDKETDAAGAVAVELRDAAQPRDFPVFFLPWAADRVVKIKLSDPRQNPNDEVRIFFTAAVDGCSVFVEGDPATPTVYHANATSYNANELDPQVAAQLILLRREKAALMRARVRAVRQGKALAANAGTVGNMRVAEHRDYAPGAVDPLSNVERTRIVSRAAKAAGTRFAAIGQGTAARRSGEQESIAPVVDFKGTVFGFKNQQGTWEFYYQVRATVLLWLPKEGADLTKKANWKHETRNLHTSLQKFWPGGSGSAVARPTTVVEWPD